MGWIGSGMVGYDLAGREYLVWGDVLVGLGGLKKAFKNHSSS